MLKVILEVMTVDQNVVQKHNHELANMRSKNSVHETLKRGRRVGKTKRHYPELKVALVCFESRFSLHRLPSSGFDGNRSECPTWRRIVCQLAHLTAHPRSAMETCF